jgi:hypothetical protein
MGVGGGPRAFDVINVASFCWPQLMYLVVCMTHTLLCVIFFCLRASPRAHVCTCILCVCVCVCVCIAFVCVFVCVYIVRASPRAHEHLWGRDLQRGGRAHVLLAPISWRTTHMHRAAFYTQECPPPPFSLSLSLSLSHTHTRITCTVYLCMYIHVYTLRVCVWCVCLCVYCVCVRVSLSVCVLCEQVPGPTNTCGDVTSKEGDVHTYF